MKMMCPNILIKDKCSLKVHRLGTNVHDSWFIDDEGNFQYHNLQNGDGTGIDGGYVFVKNEDKGGYQKNRFIHVVVRRNNE